MEHSPIMRCLLMASWFITAIVSINMLAGLYDYNIIIWLGNMMPSLIIPLMWIIGLSGAWSLIMFVKTVMMGCDGCGSCP